jgi:hypothetical protein
MDKQRRQSRLDAARSRIEEVQVHTSEVLAAMDAALDDISTTLEDPAQKLTGDALAAEVAAVRAELLAATAARDAIRAQVAKIVGPFMSDRIFEAMQQHRHELAALDTEGRRLAERVATLQAALRELGQPSG